jgi:NADPH:quinone reductase-like Zn-dependent oxidoreductase
MRAAEISSEGFGLDRLRTVTRPDPTPGPGEVLLRMRAASLNYRDLLMVRGQYNPRQPLPLVPCSDGVGEVVALGPAVSRVALGQRACPIFASGWLSGDPGPETTGRTRGGPLPGTLATHLVVAEEDLVLPPAHLTDAEAACLPCAAVTAWSALVTLGRLQPGERVLVQGTGGVALFALQLATAMGAEVIQTSSSDEKLERVRALGAVAGINYRTEPRWGRAVRDLTGGAGVDHVIELGGAGTLAESLRAVRPGGTISLIGVLAGSRAPLDITPVLMRQIRVQGVFVGHRDSFEALCAFLVANPALRPVISDRFPLDGVAAALAHMAEGGHFGKVVIDLSAAVH